MTATYGMLPARVPFVTPRSSGGVGLPDASLRSVAMAWRSMASIGTVLRHGGDHTQKNSRYEHHLVLVTRSK